MSYIALIVYCTCLTRTLRCTLVKNSFVTLKIQILCPHLWLGFRSSFVFRDVAVEGWPVYRCNVEGLRGWLIFRFEEKQCLLYWQAVAKVLVKMEILLHVQTTSRDVDSICSSQIALILFYFCFVSVLCVCGCLLAFHTIAYHHLIPLRDIEIWD